jgi:HAD superfamily hydrolase (TIGR01509 family)
VLRGVIAALLFDFDGLLYDSETAAYETWRELYAQHGVEFPLGLWQREVMGRPPGTADFDPLAHLEQLAAAGLEPEATLRARARHRDALFPGQLLPGAAELLAQARAAGIRTAIVSSNDRERILEHLTRAGAPADFDAIVTADGDAARGKPSPALYLEALARLGVPAGDAVAFEDSPNGVRSAKAAGLRVVAVPNWLTEGAAGLELADETLTSLADFDLSGAIGPPGRGRAGTRASRSPVTRA